MVSGTTYTSQVRTFSGANCTATFAVPARATIQVLAVGGGGGGGGGVLSSKSGGGGGGGEVTITTIALTDPVSLSVSVGAGGSVTTGGNGGPGGTSSISGTGVSVTAVGGGGGTSAAIGVGGSSGSNSGGSPGGGATFSGGGGGGGGTGGADGTGGANATWSVTGLRVAGGGSGGSITSAGPRKAAGYGGGLGVAKDYCLGAAIANTGGGGGGGAANASGCSPDGGAGAAGVVGISYVTTVTFDANGATGSSYSQTSGTAQALSGNTFSRAGYTFDGWATTPTGSLAYADGGSYDFAAGGATLYARWATVPVPPPPPPPPTQWTLSLNANGGSCSTSSITDTDGAWVTLPGATSCSRSGYDFIGWNTSANGSGLGFAPGGTTALTNDNTLFAQWRLATTPSPSPSTSPSPSASPSPAPTATSVPPASPSAETSAGETTTGSDGLGPIPDPSPSPTSSGVQLSPQKGTLSAGGSGTLTPTSGATPSLGANFQEGSLEIWDGQAWVQQFADPGVGTWVVLNGEVVFTPVPGFVGTASSTVKVTDSAGNSGFAPVGFTVEPIATPSPSPNSPATPDGGGSEDGTQGGISPSLTGSQGLGPIPGPSSGDAGAGDLSAQPLLSDSGSAGGSVEVLSVITPSADRTLDASSVRIWDGNSWVENFTDPGVGTWSASNGSVSFVPAPGFCGNASTTYQVSDSQGASGSAPVAFSSSCASAGGLARGSRGTGLIPGPLPPVFLGSPPLVMDNVTLVGTANVNGGVVNTSSAFAQIPGLTGATSLAIWDGSKWVTRFRDPKVGLWEVRNDRIMFTPYRSFTGTARTTFTVMTVDGLPVQGTISFDVPAGCSIPLTNYTVVGFRPNSKAPNAEILNQKLQRLPDGCNFTVSGYVQPAGPTYNDGYLSKQRATSVADSLGEVQPAARLFIKSGGRLIQDACTTWDNRCVIIRPKSPRKAPTLP